MEKKLQDSSLYLHYQIKGGLLLILKVDLFPYYYILKIFPVGLII